jgi:hypothetical protein
MSGDDAVPTGRTRVASASQATRICVASSIVFASFLALGISGCLQTEGQRRTELRERAEELLPAGAHVRALGYGDCVELAASPSCTEVMFSMRDRDPRSRAHLVLGAARRSGWTVRDASNSAGAWSLDLKTDGFTAAVFLWRPEAYGVSCKGQPDPSSEDGRVCFNTISVTRASG